MLDSREPKRGYLFLIGGAEDRKRNMLILKNIVKTSRAKNIIIIPTASNYTREVIRTYCDAFRKIGVRDVKGIDIRYRDEVDRPENFDLINNADLIFFSGGDQKRLVEIFEGSRLLSIIKDKYFNGLLHIAGTSAGAAAASNPILFDGDYKGFEKDSVNFYNGFGFLEGITIDTHFLNRERIPRLVQFLLSGKSNKGIGIDEDTCIIINPNLRFKVIGSGSVTIINTEKTTFSNMKQIEKGKNFSVNNVQIGFLSAGIKFSLKRWSVLKPDNTNYSDQNYINQTINWN